MKSKYVKYRRSKYLFRTRRPKGEPARPDMLGSVCALADIEKRLGRRLVVARIAHTAGEWVFCELREGVTP